MAIQRGPKLETNGLVLALDAANVASYPGTGTAWTDLSGVGSVSATLSGAVFDTTNGGSISFDGSNDYASLGISSIFNQFSGNFTVSLWARASGLNSNAGNLIGDWYTGNAGATSQWQITMVNSSTQLGVYRHPTGTLISAASGFSHSTWINVVLTRIGSTLTLYSNNTSVGTATNSTTFGSATGNLNIGIDGNNASEPFSGRIASVLIYNVGLTSTQVSQNYNSTKARFGY